MSESRGSEGGGESNSHWISEEIDWSSKALQMRSECEGELDSLGTALGGELPKGRKVSSRIIERELHHQLTIRMIVRRVWLKSN